ncbi:MAG: hypothetical protein Q4G49_03765 [Paracoccus sp. (in: a-proteobacteria)]|nr:hypothetical protein [Paracoccus sp. (in: a-proteobacteria)]
MPSRAIWQSVRNLLDSTNNLEQLWEEFDRIECDDDDLRIDFDSESIDKNTWVTLAREAYYAVRTRPSRNMRHTGWITLAIQLASEEDETSRWSHHKQSKVLVGYSVYPEPGGAWQFDSTSPDANGYCDECITDKYRWHHEDKSWFYAVPLDMLDSRDAVLNYIVGPTHALIRDEDAETVLGPIRDNLCLPPQTSQV